MVLNLDFCFAKCLPAIFWVYRRRAYQTIFPLKLNILAYPRKSKLITTLRLLPHQYSEHSDNISDLFFRNYIWSYTDTCLNYSQYIHVHDRITPIDFSDVFFRKKISENDRVDKIVEWRRNYCNRKELTWKRASNWHSSMIERG